MEALVAFGVNWKLLLIQAVNFSLLLVILYRYLYTPLFAMLEKRQQAIAKGIADAENAKKEMERIKDEEVVILRSAREEGGAIIEKLRKSAVEQERDILKDAQEKSVSILEDSRKKAEEEKAYILRESEKEVARMAVLAAEKILRGSAKGAV